MKYKPVAGFESIQNQQQPIRLLNKILQRGNIPHALLFTGIEGIGKRLTAKMFAMALHCRKRHGTFHDEVTPAGPFPCGDCRSCRRIGSGQHPDVLFIEPEGAWIRIGQIRSLCETLALKPFEDGMRVVIIANAQQLNAEAGNALLKVLEEPPQRTILILTALQGSDLLPTIVSRCQQFRFNPLSADTITRLMVTEQGLAPHVAESVAALADGSLTRAQRMAAGQWLQRRKWLITAGGLNATTRDEITIGTVLAFAECLAAQREWVDDSLEIMKSWLRDLVVVKHAPDKVIHQDLRDHLATASQGMDTDVLLAKIRIIQSTQRDIQANANLRLALEVMAIQLAEMVPQETTDGL